jgi:mono/diheme cytochrome c family protein
MLPSLLPKYMVIFLQNLNLERWLLDKLLLNCPENQTSFMRPIFLFSSVIFLITAACQPQQSNTSNPPTDTTAVGTLVAQDSMTIFLSDLKAKNLFPATVPVEVADDPVFHQKKKYEGILLKTILEKFSSFQKLDIQKTQIVFECEDGYNPSMPLAKVLSKKAYLCLRDQAAPAGSDWVTAVKDGQTKVVAPFYVVYTDVPASDYSFKWPYNLVRMRLVPVNDEEQQIFPAKDETMVKGYDLFRQNCLTCHALNGIGGQMGPELNYPRNITEYWKLEDIKAFVVNPKSFRHSSNMPAVTYLQTRELDEIMAYLSYMKSQKIAPPPSKK